MRNSSSLLQNKCTERGWHLTKGQFARYQGGGYTHYWRIKPSPTTKYWIIFAHAWGYDALFPNLSLFFELLTHGYGVFSFDLDGHGTESSTFLHTDHFPSALDDALKQLEAPYNHCHLIGFSLGGALVLHQLSQHSNTFCSATVISTPIQIKITIN